MQRIFWKKKTSFPVENGLSVRFWEDRWLMGEKLSEKYLRLYSLSRKQHALISEVVANELGGIVCNLEPRRRLPDLEIEDFCLLSDILMGVRLIDDNDKMQWYENKHDFPMKLAETTLDETR